jgi:ABC-type uncharacterized transport system ATPase subunit
MILEPRFTTNSRKKAKKWQSRKDSTPKVCRSASGGNLQQRIITARKVPEKRKTFETAEEILFPQAVAKAFS